ncbi:hypothetical protein HRR83_009304 [Exophiala dermatitidis]|uniref:TPR domain-containing protein n=2 Tax=Exophiala dermatitidis TaxID=5970 RepID=H6C9H7_EXODN|nr:uncharacterized protein HMPREF1120_07865 [Exophiala dermatitidis NIH/UT8656]KAJ4502025.1 hypothetical protein HRR75_008711 [Exophiala dermatitidis]EHY59886.1 hypothetical protein HMPREF1120_07865 [Exophiala dermatitidis NIH/UT8656]KAJ4502388.1 hypothetical protein HRR73_009459 [Exophiala dermatitidis]KAJ4502927.1 hypothetical protein HRR74_009467 [Exophiala dermatitidis]KAJ4530389.1 hypothetical protein HRR76_008106 [Exophiala dermatitidis]
MKSTTRIIEAVPRLASAHKSSTSRNCANGFQSMCRTRVQTGNTTSCGPRTTTRTVKTYTRPPNRFEQMVIDARLQHPILFPTLLIGAIGSVSLLTVMAYNEYMKEKASAYPPEVEEQLRLALHYTHVKPDPELSAQYFVEAIKRADEVGMDPYGKEALGIRIRFAQMLEDFGHAKGAIEVLDSITKDLQQKLVEVDEQFSLTADKNSEEGLAKAEQRKELVKGIIQNKVKVSSLYESDYIQDRASAKQTLSDAVGLVVKETKDPQTNGFTDDNGAGLTTGEIAAMLSQMGDLYATTGEEANAIQVYMLTLQPLRASCNGTRSCKEVQVMSNIASTMGVALKKPGAKINGKPATKDTLAAGRRAALKWADQAVATADVVKPQDRDEICDLALLSAQMTRGDLLLENGEKSKAREVFQSLLPILKERNIVPLIKVAEQGLQTASA